MKLSGKIIKIIFGNEDSNYYVLLVRTEDGTEKIVGNIINPIEEITYDFEIEEYEDERYGLTKRIKYYQIKKDDEKSLIAYLSSSAFKGIGIKKAEKIVKKLGIDCLEKIKADNSVLEDLKLSAEIKENLIRKIIEDDNNIDGIIELGKYNISTKMIEKIVATLGDKTLERIQENPYILIEKVEGIGFRTADRIALDLGVELNSKQRIKAGIIHSLAEETWRNGETKVEKYDLFQRADNYLYLKSEDLELISKYTEELINDGKIIVTDSYLTSSYFYEIEKSIAKNLKRLNTKPQNQILDFKVNDANITYTKEQEEAIITAINNNVSIITGGPGTGKSTVIKGIIETLKEIYQDNLNLMLMAPTGRAAKRMTETTNIKASTVHKEIFLHKNFESKDYLTANVVIIDEISMLDIEIANDLFKILASGTKVILIGDQNQLPSVGVGAFIEDLILSKQFKVVNLKKIMRQKKNSNIIKLSQMVLNNELDRNIFAENNEVYFMLSDKQGLWGRLKRILDRIIEIDGSLEDTQILIPYYKGEVGIDNINQLIQAEYNTTKEKKITYKDNVYYINDRIMQIRNNKDLDLMNGEVGKIIDCDPEKIVCEFEMIKHLKIDDFEDIKLAYAISIHKSQGSEYKNIVILMFKDYSFLLNKKMIYTAITRAKEKCIVIGDYDALAMNIAKEMPKRKTNLRELILKEANINYPKLEDGYIFKEIHEDTSVKISDFIKNKKTDE